MNISEVCKAFKDAREASGMSMRELAQRAECSPTTIQLLEKGADCQFSTMRKVALQLGGDIEVSFSPTRDRR